MDAKSKWVRLRMKCPEKGCEASLLVEWRNEGGKEVLNGIVCDNQELRDLCGRDCTWFCWEEVSEDRRRSDDNRNG
jgi:hypothetical protein